MPNSSLRTVSEIKQTVFSNHDTITIPLYCNRNYKHLSLPNKTLILNKKLSSRISEPLLITEISPNSMYVRRPFQYTILI